MNRLSGRAAGALTAVCLLATAVAPDAASGLPGEFAKLEQCPFTAPTAHKCVFLDIGGGEIVLGKKKVPIEKHIDLQGGLTEPSGGVSTLLSAKNGATFSATSQTIPGGLLGLVPEEKQNYLVKRLIKFFFENSLTGATLTPELAGSPGEIEFSEAHLLKATEIALALPLKLHIQNPFLGKRCYVGSTETPVWWRLTTGTTSPPGPNTPIKGAAGKSEFLGTLGQIQRLNGTEIVDNAWEAPAAHGCGGVIAFLVDPVVNSQLGELTAGHNTARLNGLVDLATTEAVQECAVNNIC